MKKSLIFKILYLFLVLVVVAGASVFATNAYLSARDISYGSSNVEDALNGLFTLKGNDENYSTDEKVVGKWIDGKPLYRRTYYKTNESSFVAGLDNPDTVMIYGYSYNTAGNWFPIPYIDGGYTSAIYYILNSDTIVFAPNRSDVTKTYVIVEYTKNTN